MIRQILLLCCGTALLHLSTAIHAEAIYKTVDAKGRVSYTSRNPALDNSSSPRAEQIKVDSGYNNTQPVTRIGSTDYCGSIELPTRTVNTGNFYDKVAANWQRWKQDLQRLETSAAQFSRRSQGKNSAETVQKMAEYRCAIAWAETQKSKAAEERKALTRKSEGLNDYLNDKTSAELRACGTEPVYSSLEEGFEASRQKWRNCTNEYRAKLREVESELRETDRQLLDISKIENAR